MDKLTEFELRAAEAYTEFMEQLERVQKERDEWKSRFLSVESENISYRTENIRIRQERDEIKKYHDIGFANFRKLLAEKEKADQERDKAIEAIKWYSDNEQWRGIIDGSSNIHCDGGDKARAILLELGVTE